MNNFKEILWSQFGASIDMLENAVKTCPDEVWSAPSENNTFWYTVYHTLFWLDFYLSENPNEFIPQPPFDLSELDPEGILPERVYGKDELILFLQHCRNKCRDAIRNLSNEKGGEIFESGTLKLSRLELLFYNMRHVQHHTGQLNLMLRQQINDSPRWVRKARQKLNV